MTKCLRGARVAGATVLALCLAWCCTSCGRLPSSSGRNSASCPAPRAARHVVSITQSGGHGVVPPARQLWASTLRGGSAFAEALSPDGTRLFVLGHVGSAVKSETVAYSTATGAQLWADAYPPHLGGGPGLEIAVSPDGGAGVHRTGQCDHRLCRQH